MGEIILEGEEPYEPLFANTASAKPTRDAVELIVNVDVDGLPAPAVAIRILLAPEVADEVAGQLKIAAGIVERWQRRP